MTHPTNKMGPYAHGGGQWVGYDDPAMAAVKAQYILDNKLGGGMFWDLPSDDFRNKFVVVDEKSMFNHDLIGVVAALIPS